MRGFSSFNNKGEGVLNCKDCSRSELQ